MLPSALSKAPLHSLYQDNQNKEECDFFGHMSQLPWSLASVSVLYDAYSIKSVTIIFLGQVDAIGIIVSVTR